MGKVPTVNVSNLSLSETSWHIHLQGGTYHIDKSIHISNSPKSLHTYDSRGRVLFDFSV